MSRLRFHIRRSQELSGYGWSRFIALMNDICGMEMWTMEVVYNTKLVVVVTMKMGTQLEEYIALFNSLARTNLIDEDYDYEEFTG